MIYTPFNDTLITLRSDVTVGIGYSTSGIDIYRQGVEITSSRFRFLGSQPKFWSGNTNGYTDAVTYGQNPGTIDSNAIGLESKYEDLPEFNPVAYIQYGVTYPLPIVFNDGPGEQLEATIEPLTIPFKKPTNEGPFYAHDIRAEMEGGNRSGRIGRSTNMAEQFIELYPVPALQFFLDEGAGSFGNIPLDPYIFDDEQESSPFDDTLSYSIGSRLTATGSVFQQHAYGRVIPGDDSILPFGKKSASAGGSYYGPNAALYGTDSIAYAGWSAGS